MVDRPWPPTRAPGALGKVGGGATIAAEDLNASNDD
jgi:hypothetical protein